MRSRTLPSPGKGSGVGPQPESPQLFMALTTESHPALQVPLRGGEALDAKAFKACEFETVKLKASLCLQYSSYELTAISNYRRTNFAGVGRAFCVVP